MALTGDFVTGQTVPFQRFRQMMLDNGGGLQEGVVGASDFAAQQRVAGANMSVDVGLGFAWVQVDTGTRNGLAHVTNDATANVATFAAAHATLPRIDQVILRYNDSSIPTGSGNTPTLAVLTGTATAGATLANRTGAVALGNDAMRICDALVPAAATTITNANIRDRRPWARGVFGRQNVASGGTYTTTSGTNTAIDATNLSMRLECSGVPIKFHIQGAAAISAVSQAGYLVPFIDSGQFDVSFVYEFAEGSSEINGFEGFGAEWIATPTAGSHLFQPAFSVSGAGAATFSVSKTATDGLLFTVEEIVRQNTVNNVLTSG